MTKSTAGEPSVRNVSATDALIYVRNIIFTIGPATALILTTLLALQVYKQLHAAEQVAIAVIAVVSVTAGFLLTLRWRPWLFAASMAVVLVLTITSPGTNPPWVPIIITVSYLAYITVVMSSRRVGLIAVLIGPFVLLALWFGVPQAIIPGSLPFLGGTLTILQFLFASGLLWLVWNRLRVEAAASDVATDQAVARTLQMVRQSDRAQMWASSAKHLHETLLNTLGFLRSSATVDAAELQSFLSRQRQQPDIDSVLSDTHHVETSSEQIDTASVGRYLLTAPVAGNAMGGFGFACFILFQDGLSGLGPAVVALASASIAVYIVWRHRRISRRLTLGLALLPAVMPWVFLLVDVDCTEALLAASMINFAGYAILAVMIWGSPVMAAIGLGLWGLGSFAFWSQLDPECRQFLTIALVNLLLLLPIVLVLLTKGAQTLAASQRRANIIRDSEVLAQAHALAWLDVQREFEAVMQACTEIIAQVAEGRPLDAETRRALDACDTRLRILLLADPFALGTFGMVARALANRALERGIEVKVNSIAGSVDDRPLTEDVLRTLHTIVDGTSRLTIQVITDGRDDYLSLNVDRAALSALAGHAGSWGDTQLSLDDPDPTLDPSAEPGVVLLTRRVRLDDLSQVTSTSGDVNG